MTLHLSQVFFSVFDMDNIYTSLQAVETKGWTRDIIPQLVLLVLTLASLSFLLVFKQYVPTF